LPKKKGPANYNEEKAWRGANPLSLTKKQNGVSQKGQFIQKKTGKVGLPGKYVAQSGTGKGYQNGGRVQGREN